MSYRDLSLPHDAVRALSVVFVLLGLVVTLLVAEQPQGLRALQLDLKLLEERKTTTAYDKKKPTLQWHFKTKGKKDKNDTEIMTD